MLKWLVVLVVGIVVITIVTPWLSRYGLDPDNFGIPLVSGTSDLLGAVALILSLVIFGLT